LVGKTLGNPQNGFLREKAGQRLGKGWVLTEETRRKKRSRRR